MTSCMQAGIIFVVISYVVRLSEIGNDCSIRVF